MEPNEKRQSFYIGTKACGCVTAAMVDDEQTTAKDVADFAREMHKTGRKLSHVEMTEQQFMDSLKACECKNGKKGGAA